MKIFQKIKLLLGAALSHAGHLITDCVTPALHVVEVIKSVVNNPALDLLTELSKTELDNAVLKKVRSLVAYLPETLIVPADRPTLNGMIESVRTMSPGMQSAVYAKIASTIAVGLSGGKLKEAEADTLTQMAYASKKAAAGA